MLVATAAIQYLQTSKKKYIELHCCIEVIFWRLLFFVIEEICIIVCAAINLLQAVRVYTACNVRLVVVTENGRGMVESGYEEGPDEGQGITSCLNVCWAGAVGRRVAVSRGRVLC